MFLTYLELNKPNMWKSFFDDENFNIYIHPKFSIDSNLKKYVIQQHIDTNWNDISLVQATILLIKEAIVNKENKFFILCSNSCIPLYDEKKFIEFINLKNNYSIFHVIKHWGNIYKTSQFWILNREDALIVLQYASKYIEIFSNKEFIKKYITGNAAYDELFFLTLLKTEIKHYKFLDMMSTYVKWFDPYIAKHPLTYLAFTKIDKKDFKKQGSFFVRKVDENFNKKVIYKTLFIIYIGKYTKNDFFDKLINLTTDCNLMIMTYNDDYDIPQKLFAKAIYVWRTRGKIDDIKNYFINYQKTFFKKRFKNVYLLGDENSEYVKIF